MNDLTKQRSWYRILVMPVMTRIQVILVIHSSFSTRLIKKDFYGVGHLHRGGSTSSFPCKIPISTIQLFGHARSNIPSCANLSKDRSCYRCDTLIQATLHLASIRFCVCVSIQIRNLEVRRAWGSFGRGTAMSITLVRWFGARAWSAVCLTLYKQKERISLIRESTPLSMWYLFYRTWH